VTNDETLKAGIEAAKSGDLVRAAALFAEVVKVDPTSEQGWMFLGMSITARDRREYCFRRVLAINPNNKGARAQLDRLAGPPKPPPAPVPESKPAAPPAQAAPPKPFVSNEPQNPPPPRSMYTSAPIRYTFPEDETPEQAPPTYIEPISTPATMSEAAVIPGEKIPPTPVPNAAAKAVPKKKKTNTTLVVVLGILAALIVCGAVGVFLFLNSNLNQLLSGNIPAIGAPLPLVPTALTIPQGSSSPTSASNPTLVPPTLAPTSLPTARPIVSYKPILEKVNCPFDVPPGANVSCSFVIVPEDRTGDPSHTIRLAVAVYHSTSSNPAPDPVVFLQGGPGGEAVKLITGYYQQLVVPIIKTRDFIAFDQRGTGLSEPALNCDELSKAYLQDVQGLIPPSTRGIVYSNAMVSCNGLMRAKGIDLNAYTTVESADDIKDILSLLGYQKADLYGASYGTRLAQVVVRDHPEIVNSVILDSVVPVESNFFIQYPLSMEAGLKNLFISCASDPSCNAAYPNLETVFNDLLKQLDSNPVTITTGNPRTGTVTQSVDGSTVMNIVLGSVKESSLIYTAPQTIYRFKNGDFSTLIATQSSLPFGFEGINIGLFISMMCHEHILASTPEELQATSVSSKDIEEYAWLPFYGSAENIFRTCQSWEATGPTLGENAPVNSDVPTLVITGKFDPTTPPMYAQQVASHLSHSYFFEFPNQGHVPTATDRSGCAMATVVSFLNNPSVEPDHTCVNNLPPIHFLTPYTGTPAISLTQANVGGMTDKVPENWTPTGDGFFFRGESPFDITSVGFLEVNVSSSGLREWFSMKAYGYRGFDTALIPAGTRQANNLKWTLYTSTSYGRPVDVAMADYHGRSLVVMSFCNSDEHDAFYKTVFLPMVDSAQP
jgi:pimeloyl-ACP methyl ester carboxylesterase